MPREATSDPSPLHVACSTSGPPLPPPPLVPHPPSCLMSPQPVSQQRVPGGKEEPAEARGMGLTVWETGTAEPASAGTFPLKEGCQMTQSTATKTAWGAGVQDRCSRFSIGAVSTQLSEVLVWQRRPPAPTPSQRQLCLLQGWGVDR